MSISYPSSASLRSIISLIEKRDTLLSKLEDVGEELSSLLSNKAPLSKSPKLKRGRGKAVKSRKRGRRGAMKEKILGALREAGAKGAGAKEIAAKLGVKSANVHVWFSTTGKKIKGLKKTGPGKWVLMA